MTKFERIQKMRLDHANGCCNPPPTNRGRKSVYEERLNKRSEREVIESPDEPFRVLAINPVYAKIANSISNGNY